MEHLSQAHFFMTFASKDSHLIKKHNILRSLQNFTLSTS